MNYILHLASQSPSRKKLLEESNIPFKIISQNADESACDWGLPLDKLVASISLYKMEHAVLPSYAQEGDIIFVLTSDTLSQDRNGVINGKPKDREDAIKKIKEARQGSRLCTAFCVDKKQFISGKWHLVERVHEVVAAEYLFYIPDRCIDDYLDNSIGLQCSNAIAIEGYGNQFLQYVKGSYSAIVGLPMYELREALEKLGFFE